MNNFNQIGVSEKNVSTVSSDHLVRTKRLASCGSETKSVAACNIITYLHEKIGRLVPITKSELC